MKRFFAFIIMLLLLLSVSACSLDESDSSKKTGEIQEEVTPGATEQSGEAGGTLKIHYIDVGQGDSILLQQGGKNMLIDAGTNKSTDSLLKYLDEQNIDKIDYLILTHPHEDHIGGADKVISRFNIGTVIMPKITASTKTFKDVVSAMNAKNLKATSPVPGSKFKLGDADCTILGPINSDRDDLNTYSVVLKVKYKDASFMFTGDAQASNEQDMIGRGYDLKADVLKAGHHGSRTSSSQDFLDRVNPRYAVISCGKGNDYGHPHKQIMDRLKKMGIKVYRTDESGTIICTSNGKNISFNRSLGSYKSGS